MKSMRVDLLPIGVATHAYNAVRSAERYVLNSFFVDRIPRRTQ
jgi:hypothetical protein